MAGIHGRSNDGAYSLVLAGGYEDDVVCFKKKSDMKPYVSSNVQSAAKP